MKYKIIVDKQSRLNPSAEKREYEIDIEELRCKGNIYDSLVITKDEDYVMRRLALSKFHVLSVLEEPIKEPLQDINIELFEGNNYIYLVDMTGNKFYAEYLIKNEFNELYVIRSEMNSAINQSAKEIELSVNQKLTEYSTTEEMNAAIKVLANAIALQIAKKVNDEDLTSANIILRINEDDSSEAQINADKININGTISANGNFKVDKNGNMQAKNGTFTGGTISLTDTSQIDPRLHIEDGTYENNVFANGVRILKPINADTYSLRLRCGVDSTQDSYDITGYGGEGSTYGYFIAKSTEFSTFVSGNVNISASEELSLNSHNRIQLVAPITKSNELQCTNLIATGTKNRAVKIEDDKYILLNAYETATPYFGDIGSNKTDESGYCRIDIDTIFKQTIELEDYKVFIQECGNGKLYVEKHNGYFEIKGTPNLEFDWELKAVQKGHKNTRLEELKGENNG